MPFRALLRSCFRGKPTASEDKPNARNNVAHVPPIVYEPTDKPPEPEPTEPGPKEHEPTEPEPTKFGAQASFHEPKSESDFHAGPQTSKIVDPSPPTTSQHVESHMPGPILAEVSQSLRANTQTDDSSSGKSEDSLPGDDLDHVHNIDSEQSISRAGPDQSLRPEIYSTNLSNMALAVNSGPRTIVQASDIATQTVNDSNPSSRITNFSTVWSETASSQPGRAWVA